MKDLCKYILSIACLALLNNCAIGTEEGEYHDSTAYIVCFLKSETIELVPEYSENDASLVVGLQIYMVKPLSWDAFGSGEGGVFDELCVKYGDTGYRRTVYRNFETRDFPMWPRANASSYRSIAVVAGKSWNSTHDVGSDIGDLIRLESKSYYPYIKSKYSLSEPVTYIIKRIPELLPEDRMMMGDSEIATLYFLESPADPGVYPVTVKLTTDEGEVFEASADVEFR